jgi:hypothetical protein
MRQTFLHQELGGNPHIRITLIPFGSDQDKERIEVRLRELLGCSDTRFADAIRDPDRGTGFIEELYADLPEEENSRINTLVNRIEKWKEKVVQAGQAQEAGLPGRFQNHIAKQCKDRPEFLDRLRLWWPEDSLIVSYSREADGQNFYPLTTGSAGQKAAALLAFFLAHGETPLIIDQPENDLDNHLVTDLVVRQLKQNKQRRQIIVVTHNPNIVVNGDAEMVHSMHFVSGECKAKASGPLQEEAVRTEVCEVMEGGRESLKSRFQRLM